MLVRKFINFDEPLTPEEKAELEALKNMQDEDIVFDEDYPPMTEEQLEELSYLMRKYKTRRITKEIFIAEGKIKTAS